MHYSTETNKYTLCDLKDVTMCRNRCKPHYDFGNSNNNSNTICQDLDGAVVTWKMLDLSCRPSCSHWLRWARYWTLSFFSLVSVDTGNARVITASHAAHTQHRHVASRNNKYRNILRIKHEVVNYNLI